MLLLCLAPRSALGFCRTTTCNPQREQDHCQPNQQGCATRGEPVFWSDACVTFAVQERGSPRRGISAYDTDLVMGAAFSAWLGAECPGGGHPSLGVVPLGGASCDQVEFNGPEGGRPLTPNANLVIYRDGAWPYQQEEFVIARTSITFDPLTGVIFDADIELNSFDNEFSISDTRVSNDLQSVLTHEVGHFLGLDHTLVPNATMLADYELSNLGTRTLSNDDRAGICTIYEPLPDGELVCPGSTGPHHGYSRECGTSVHADASCLSVAGTAPGRGSGWLPWLALGLLGLFRLRRG
jgi:Matrixin